MLVVGSNVRLQSINTIPFKSLTVPTVNLTAIREKPVLTDYYTHHPSSGDGVANMRTSKHMQLVYLEEPATELHTNLRVYRGWCGNRDNLMQPDEDPFWPREK
jgi:hypothetical protein